MALSRLELRKSDLAGITGAFGEPLAGADLGSGGGGTIPDAPRRDVRLSSEKGSVGVPGSSSGP